MKEMVATSVRKVVSKLLFDDEIFKRSLVEIEALGFTISEHPTSASTPYGVIGGRSNQRWWLIPLANRSVAISGMALFQPILTSAKLLKSACVMASVLGLSNLWAREKIYISKKSHLEEVIGRDNLNYAFFTGTDSPHRKTAIQIMEQDGSIKGFAKLAQNSNVKPLLTHEAETLQYLQTLELQSAIIPAVLYIGDIGHARVLVTDTLKTAKSITLTTLTEHHRAFLTEMAEKTGNEETLANSEFLQKLHRQIELHSSKLPVAWNKRLTAALQIISIHASSITAEMVFCHGDFTPWNTFMVSEKLYVFDWEYAQQGCPPGYDVIHFILSLPAVKRQPINKTIGQIRKLLQEMKIAGDDTSADILFLCYLCAHSLQYSAREIEVNDTANTWDGEQEAAAYIDAIIARKI